MAFEWHESGDLAPTELPTISVYCCREWIVISFSPWGACGDCGEVPVRQCQKD